MPAPGTAVTLQGAVDSLYDIAVRQKGATSTGSILQNLAGTVPNRLDDLMGEVANVQLYSPEIVVGYIMVFDVSKDRISKKHDSAWCELLEGRLSRLSGRRAPAWTVGTIEAFVILRVDFSEGPKLLTDETNVLTMVDELVVQVKERNPGIP